MDAIKIPVTTAGAAGVASGSAATGTDVSGKVYAVHLSYDSGAPATTDAVLIMENSPSEAIISKVNNATASWILPRRQVHDNAGVALQFAAGGSGINAEPFPVVGRLVLSVVQCDAIASAPACVATVYLER